jgi:hypothetical protein
MSEDRFEQEEPKDEDVEAHGFYPRDTPATGEPGDESDDDVEAHRKKSSLTDDRSDDDSDFELHRKRA